MIDFLKNKSIQKCLRLIEMLNFYEFDDNILTQKTLHNMVTLFQNLLKGRNIMDFLFAYKIMGNLDHSTMKNYAFSIFNLEKLISDKLFPSSLVKSPFIRI